MSEPRTQPRADLLAAAALVVLVVWLFSDVLVRGRAFFERDVFFQWTAQAEAFVRVLAAGSWPVWSPWGSFGQPMWANMNNQVLYPFTWLNLLLPAPRYYVAFVVFHALLGGAGTFVLARRIGLGRAGALVASTVWTASGPALSLVSLWNHLAAAAWLPWILAAAERALAVPSMRAVVLWGAALAVPVLVGSPDLFVFAVLLSALLVARRIPVRALRGPAARAGAGAFALSLLLAFGLSAAQWLPSADLLGHSSRRDWSAYDRDFWSIHPRLLGQLVLPAFIDTLPLAAAQRDELFESREPYLHSHYLGLVALGLVAAALAGPRRPLRGTLAGASVAAALFALGRHTPFYEVSLALAPPLGLLRFPSKALIVVALAWALLSGMGYEAWREGLPRRRGLAVAGCLALAVAAGATIAFVFLMGPRADALAASLLGPLPPGTAAHVVFAPVRTSVATATALGGIALVLALLAFMGGPTAQRGLLAGLAALLAVADTALAHRALNPTAPVELYAGHPRLVDLAPDARLARVYVYDYVTFPLKTRQHLGANGLTLSGVPPGTSPLIALALALRDYGQPSMMGAYGVETSFDFDLLGLHPPERVRLARFLRDVEGRPAHLKLLRMAGVRLVETLDEQGFGDLEPLTSFRTLLSPPVRLYRVPDPLPRFYVVGGVRPADDADGLRTVPEPGFDPTREVILPGVSAVPPDPAFTGQALLRERRPDRVRLEATLNGDGYVVLLDGYDPGWKATVDGRPSPVLRANMVFRAVRLGAGRHVVEFVYRPWSVTAGLGVSGLCLLLCGLAWWREPSRTALAS